MSHIYVNQLNFEYEESNSYHDILVNSGGNTPSLVEQVTTPTYIYVNIVNLEIPVAGVLADTLTNTGTATHTLEEVITGTPIEPEPEPEVGHTGAAKRPYYTYIQEEVEALTATAHAQHLIGEEIFVHEIAETYSYNVQDIETKVRRPIYKQPRKIEILSFTPDDRTIIIPNETPKINSRQKEEEELLLLGII